MKIKPLNANEICIGQTIDGFQVTKKTAKTVTLQLFSKVGNVFKPVTFKWDQANLGFKRQGQYIYPGKICSISYAKDYFYCKKCGEVKGDFENDFCNKCISLFQEQDLEARNQ